MTQKQSTNKIFNTMWLPQEEYLYKITGGEHGLNNLVHLGKKKIAWLMDFMSKFTKPRNLAAGAFIATF